MNTASTKRNTSVRTGQTIAGIVIAVLLLDAGVLLMAPELMAASMKETGFPLALAPIIGAILLASVALYALPRTRVIGGILLTAFLGGAICTHLRIGEIGSPPQLVSLFLGLGVWLSLHLRRGTLPEREPLRNPDRTYS